MSHQNIYKTLKSDYLMLLPIMALAYYLAFIPHQGYPYPVHLDEWLALGGCKALLQGGNFLTVGMHPLKTGFYLFWGVFHQISGISWMDIFRYFPGIVFMITILSAYILGKRQGFGLYRLPPPSLPVLPDLRTWQQWHLPLCTLFPVA